VRVAGTERIEREIEKLKARLRSNNGSQHKRPEESGLDLN
jgi:hypothetical protein